MAKDFEHTYLSHLFCLSFYMYLAIWRYWIGIFKQLIILKMRTPYMWLNTTCVCISLAWSALKLLKDKLWKWRNAIKKVLVKHKVNSLDNIVFASLHILNFIQFIFHCSTGMLLLENMYVMVHYVNKQLMKIWTKILRKNNYTGLNLCSCQILHRK